LAWCLTDHTEGFIDLYDTPGIVLTEIISDDLMRGLGMSTGGTTAIGKEGAVSIEMTTELLPGMNASGMMDIEQTGVVRIEMTVPSIMKGEVLLIAAMTQDVPITKP
jgi:hypothetical protein